MELAVGAGNFESRAIHARDAFQGKLVADFAKPVRNAAAVARAIRERVPQLPILFVSGYTDTAALEAAAGNAPLLRKPFRPSALAAAIRVRLDQ